MKITQAYPVALALTAFLFVPTVVKAQFDTLTPFTGTSSAPLLESITNIINALLALVALIAGIALVFSTITALSGRDQEDVARRAKTTIVYILIGLIVIALSAVIINFFIRAIP